MGAGGVKIFSVAICDGAPSTARSSSILFAVALVVYGVLCCVLVVLQSSSQGRALLQ